MGTWVDGWMWGCLPDELSSTKNPESIFLSTPKKGEAGPSSAGTTDFLFDFVEFRFPFRLSDYLSDSRLRVPFSFWVSFEFWFSDSDSFFSNFLSTSKEEEGAPQVGKLIYGSLQVLCQKQATAITDILPAVAGNLSLFFKKNYLNCDFMIGMSLSTNLAVLYWKLSKGVGGLNKILIALRYFDIKLT